VLTQIKPIWCSHIQLITSSCRWKKSQKR